jgi:hypothetical protein
LKQSGNNGTKSEGIEKIGAYRRKENEKEERLLG